MDNTPGLTYAHCREVALGRMMMTPLQFGNMLAGDFLDALAGYSNGEFERMKSLAELLRIQTTILWNIQVDKENKLMPSGLWPLPWDNIEDVVKAAPSLIDEEELKKAFEMQEQILGKM